MYASPSLLMSTSEVVGSDFPTSSMAGMRDKAVARRGEHRVCTHGAHSMGTVAPLEMVPCGTHWHTRTNASACQ